MASLWRGTVFVFYLTFDFLSMKNCPVFWLVSVWKRIPGNPEPLVVTGVFGFGLIILSGDVSFITSDNRLIILVEHQSTINPNMALRLLLYYIELVQLWLKHTGKSLFSGKYINDVPVPEFYVAYHGRIPLKEKCSVFKMEHGGIKIDVRVEIIDIRLSELDEYDTENTLAGYSYFYNVYDEHIRAGASIKEALEAARDSSVAGGYLKGYVDKEDFTMNYKDWLDYGEQLRYEAMEEGEARGLEKSIRIAFQSNVPLSAIESMAKAAGIPLARLAELQEQAL